MDTVYKPQIQDPKLLPPSSYQVALLNDDYTPMDFVVIILQKFFNMDLNQATKVMMQVHTEGKGICGVYDKDIAETRTHQVNNYAQANKHILKSIVEKID